MLSRFVLLVLVFAMVSLLEYDAGAAGLGAFPWGFMPLGGSDFEGGHLGATVVTTVVVACTGLTLLWTLARDMHIRTRTG